RIMNGEERRSSGCVTENDKNHAKGDKSLMQRFETLKTGIKKKKIKFADRKYSTEATDNIDLQLKISQLSKEAEESREELEQYRREFENEKAKWKTINAEFNRYKLKSQDSKKTLEFQVELKATEIEHLKKTETELKSELAEMKHEVKSKSEEIEKFKMVELELRHRISRLETDIALEATRSAQMTQVDVRRVENDQQKIDSDANYASAEFERFKLESKYQAQLKANEIDFLKKSETQLKTELTEMKNDIKTKSEEIEKLKLEGQDDRKNLEFQIHLKTTEIEYLKKTETELRSRLAEMENELKSKSEKIENLKMNGTESNNGTSQLSDNEETHSVDLKGLHNQTNEMILRARFTNISELTHNPVVSQATEFAGLSWKIRLRKKDDHLAFFVVTQNSNADKWSCSAFVDYQLISQKDGSIIHSMNGKRADVYTDEIPLWGFKTFISFKDLFEESKGFVKEDSIIVSAAIKAFPNAQ
ncbi:hypothetical protein PENTCL1PPCAC_20488, partial [Pristionchus entomophagus]